MWSFLHYKSFAYCRSISEAFSLNKRATGHGGGKNRRFVIVNIILLKGEGTPLRPNLHLTEYHNWDSVKFCFVLSLPTGRRLSP